MKRFMLLSLLIYAASCSNPEDRATGNPDNKRFNSDENKVTNSRPGPTDPNSQRSTEVLDSSVSPSTSKENSNSPTQGTNRSYGTTGDSAHH